MGVIICTVCKEEKDESKFGMSFDRGYRRKVCEQCRYMKKRARLWLAFLKHFDYKCQCCGEDDIRFLTLDHVQNDGHKEESNNTFVVIRRALEEGVPKDKYSCLCWNCNCGRAKNGGVCPHRDVLVKQEYFNKYNQIGELLLHQRGVRTRLYSDEERKERAKVALKKFDIKKNFNKLDSVQIQELLKALQK